MLKVLGIFCILAGSTGIGALCAAELDLRIRELEELEQRMLLLKGEIRYMHRPLPEAFLHLSAGAPPPFHDFFRHMGEELQERLGCTADSLWKKNMKQDLQGLHINGQEWSGLEALGGMLGYLDVEMQINTLDHYLEQLKRSVARAADTAESRRKLYRYMGALGGAALVILIF